MSKEASLNDKRFGDGAAYERMMGTWTKLAGNQFLDWVAAQPGLRWLDIGCGNGAFTELICSRCAPASVHGLDPAPAQIAFARARPGAQAVDFRAGDAMALPYDESAFDAATMALVIFFVPDPAKGVSEMVRVVRPGGLIAAYAWDVTRNGAPFEPVWDEMSKLGIAPNRPPSAPASRMEALLELWTGAGITAVETKEIVVHRAFVDFEEFWSITTAGYITNQIADLKPADRDLLKNRVRARMPTDAVGRIYYSAKANAVKGLRPA
ncbi:MAG: class I SAM-dependent methyltransferase [Hyphomicrobiaceae bacterium]